MKEKVIELLRNAELSAVEKYNEAMALYRRSEGHSVPAANYYNRSGFTEPNLKNLCYDLQKLHGIGDADLRRAKLEVVKESPKALPEELVVVIVGASAQQKAAFILIAPGVPADIYAEHEEVAEELALTYSLFIEEHKEQWDAVDASIPFVDKYKMVCEAIGDFQMPERYVPLKEALVGIAISGPTTVGDGLDLTQKPQVDAITLDVPEEAATGLKVREEFPFLNADDCPDKLKILVADRITAWHKYKEAHAELLKHANGEAMTDAEILALVQTAVEKFELNQAIWEELKHYKEHGEILGNHEIFKDDMLAKEVGAMGVKDLMKRQKSLRTYVSRDTKKLEAATDDESKAKIAAKVAEWKKELDLVDAKLAEK
jgi:hypothetical protein